MKNDKDLSFYTKKKTYLIVGSIYKRLILTVGTGTYLWEHQLDHWSEKEGRQWKILEHLRMKEERNLMQNLVLCAILQD